MASTRRSTTFPRLLIGNEMADETTNVKEYVDRMAELLTTLNALEPKGPPEQFRAKSFSVDINGLGLTAHACSPAHYDFDDSDVFNLIVPLYGSNVSTYDHRTYEWQAGQSAIYFPPVGRGGYASCRSVLTLRLEPSRLIETVRCMQGSDEAPRLVLDEPRLLPLNKGDMSLLEPLRSIGALIDSLAARPDALVALNLDDTLYRWMGLLFVSAGDAGQSQVQLKDPSVRSRLDRACQYALSRLDSGITLTDMEREAGMSSRNLQYAFAKHFGQTPMMWIREQRLIKARNRLLAPRPYDTVTTIALACGFGKPSAFARYYRESYGELPSDTLRSALGHYG